MRKRILFCATIDYHFSAFHEPSMQWFQHQGWEVHVAAHGNNTLRYCDEKYNLPLSRSPLHPNNIRAYFRLKELIAANDYAIIYCHTPVCSALARLAAREARQHGVKVIYAAHGFHFYQGAPLLYWLMYYPIECYLASETDCLITINAEDYHRAVHRLSMRRVELVHGMGVDTERFFPVSLAQKNALRKKHGYAPDMLILAFAAELNRNKNQGLLIKAIARLVHEFPRIRLLLAGAGAMRNAYGALAQKLHIAEYVEFLGPRTDVQEIYQLCDIAVSSSLREGLGLNLVEALACGKPVVAMNNRGHRELITDGENGYLTENDPREMADRIRDIATSAEVYHRMSDATQQRIKQFTRPMVMAELEKIYRQYLPCMTEELPTMNA